MGSGSILLADLTAPQHDELETGQLFQTHGPSRVYPGGADADFSPEAELVAVVQAGGGIDQYRACIDFLEESHRPSIVRGDDGFGVAGSILRNVFDRLIDVLHNLHGK